MKHFPELIWLPNCLAMGIIIQGQIIHESTQGIAHYTACEV